MDEDKLVVVTLLQDFGTHKKGEVFVNPYYNGLSDSKQSINFTNEDYFKIESVDKPSLKVKDLINYLSKFDGESKVELGYYWIDDDFIQEYLINKSPEEIIENLEIFKSSDTLKICE